jgi:predicted ABC-type ATPase
VSSPSRHGPEQPPESPVCTILGGPNGSGKSSIYAALGLTGRFVNADLVARQLNPEHPQTVAVAAGKRVLRELVGLLAARQSFIYETTLSSHQSIDLMRRARDAGYEVNLAFVALRDAELHVERVALRVAAGGHDIPNVSIRRRYATSFVRLVEAIRLSDGTTIFDNSEMSGPRLLVQIARGVIGANHLDAALSFHQRIASIVGEAVGVPSPKVFASASPGPS